MCIRDRARFRQAHEPARADREHVADHTSVLAEDAGDQPATGHIPWEDGARRGGGVVEHASDPSCSSSPECANRQGCRVSGTGGYRDGAALWAAMTSRAKETANATRADHGALVRRFVYDRFLARVFHDLDAPWVLKGGTAVLARVNNARTTKDVDLLVELDNLDIALEWLRASVAVDLGDHFRFVITGYDASVGGAGQPQVGGYRVHVDAYCGGHQEADVWRGPCHRFAHDDRT